MGRKAPPLPSPLGGEVLAPVSTAIDGASGDPRDV